MAARAIKPARRLFVLRAIPNPLAEHARATIAKLFFKEWLNCGEPDQVNSSQAANVAPLRNNTLVQATVSTTDASEVKDRLPASRTTGRDRAINPRKRSAKPELDRSCG